LTSHIEHAQDLAILDFAQLFDRQPALLLGRVRVFQLLRTQEAADLVSAVFACHIASMLVARP
jgi:hypothetical protein